MSYRSGGSHSGGGSRRSSSRAGSSGGGGWQGGTGWDDGRGDDDDRGYGTSRGGSSRGQGAHAERRPSRGGWDDGRGDDDWGAPRGGRGPSGRRQGYSGGWDDDADVAWEGPRGANRGQRTGRRRSSKGWVLAFVGLLVVIGVAVIGVLVLPGRGSHPTVTIADDPFATVTPGATPTIPDQFKAFQSDRSKYSIIYPQAWTATSQEHTTQGQYDYIDVFALQNAPSQLLVEQAGAAANYTDQQLIQNAVTLAQQNDVTFTKAQTQNAAPKIGGATWARQDYSVNANGTPVYMAVLACHHSGRGYVIVLVSSASEFGNDDQAVFEPMLASFTFL